jgi:hypothetical protein
MCKFRLIQMMVLTLCASSLVIAAEPPATKSTTPDFCVAPGGNDADPGTVEKPFRTLQRARDAVRQVVASPSRDVTVLLRGGIYELNETLVWTSVDGATNGHTVTWAAWPGETPIISGGRQITGWKKQDGERWTADLAEVKAGNWFFRQLFVDGKRATRARHPNYPEVLRVGDVSPDVKTITISQAAPVNLAGQDAEIVVFQNWSISRALITASEGTKVTTANSVGWMGHGPMTTTSPGKPLFLEHAREFLDQPGEWYLDRKAGVVTYVGKPGEDLMQRRVTAARLERLISIEGAAGKPVRGLRFRGLQFEGAEFLLPSFGYSEIQAGHYGPSTQEPIHVQTAALLCRYAEDCRFEQCRVSQSGGAGIAFGAGCRENAVIGCRIEDIGGNGVMVGWRETGKLEPGSHGGLASDWADPADAPQGNLIGNNLFQRCGAVSHGSVGVFVAFSEGTRIAHNLIRDMPYTGISVGYRWNTTPTTQKNSVVESNHIHDVMRMLADGGGIYTLGFQPDTVLRGNLIHHVHRSAFAHGGAPNNGMFIDEGSKGFHFDANTVFATSGAPVRFNACEEKWHTWKDNAFGNAGLYQREEGKVNQALSCIPGSEPFKVPHIATLEPEQLTLSAWIFLPEYPTGEDARRWIVNKNGNEWDNGHYALIVDGKEAGAYLNIGGGAQNCFAAISSSAPLTLKRWHHLAATYDGRNVHLFVDGATVASKSIDRNRVNGDKPLVIGQREDGYGKSHFAGRVDEVRVYGRALSGADIRAMAEDPAKSPAEGLAGEWNFDEDRKEGTPAARMAGQAGLQEPYRSELLRSE